VSVAKVNSPEYYFRTQIYRTLRFINLTHESALFNIVIVVNALSPPLFFLSFFLSFFLRDLHASHSRGIRGFVLDLRCFSLLFDRRVASRRGEILTISKFDQRPSKSELKKETNIYVFELHGINFMSL